MILLSIEALTVHPGSRSWLFWVAGSWDLRRGEDEDRQPRSSNRPLAAGCSLNHSSKLYVI